MHVIDASTVPVSDVNSFGPVRSGKVVLYGPVAAIDNHIFDNDDDDDDDDDHDDLDSSEMERPLFESAVINWNMKMGSRDPNCVFLLFTPQKGLVLEPVRKPGVARGIYQCATLPSFDGRGRAFEDGAGAGLEIGDHNRYLKVLTFYCPSAVRNILVTTLPR